MIPRSDASPPSADDWLGSFVPLGKLEQETWTPVGAGVLFVDTPVVWLLTSRSVIDAVGDAPLSGWVRDQGSGTIIDLSTGRQESDLGWIRSPEDDVAVCLFPVDPAWRVKAFTEAQCFPPHDLEALLPTATLCGAYGLAPLTGWSPPQVLAGNMTAVDRESGQLVTTSPLLPRNSGAPLLVPMPSQSGGGVHLAGIMSHTVSVPEPHNSTAAPFRLAVGQPVSAALALIRSDEGKAQRRRAVSTTQKPA